MNLIATGSTGLALSLQARSKSEEQEACSTVIGSGTSMKLSSPLYSSIHFVFSNKVSGTGGFMFRAWLGLIWLYCLSQILIAT